MPAGEFCVGAAAGEAGNRFQRLTARSSGVGFMFADVRSLNTVICLRLFYRNVTTPLRQVYDFLTSLEYPPHLMKWVTWVSQVSVSSLFQELQWGTDSDTDLRLDLTPSLAEMKLTML